MSLLLEYAGGGGDHDTHYFRFSTPSQFFLVAESGVSFAVSALHKVLNKPELQEEVYSLKYNIQLC